MKQMMTRLVTRVLLLLVIFTSLPLQSLGNTLNIYTKEILIVQSYQRDYLHTRRLEEGIIDYLNTVGERVRVRYEFLDTRNHHKHEDLEAIARILSSKYASLALDGVILCDDDALLFHLSHGADIWPTATHIVATGINSLAPYKIGIPGIVLIEERPGIRQTIQIALEQNASKGIDTLSFIYDHTTTGLQVHREIHDTLISDYKSYKANHYLEKTPAELKRLIGDAPTTELFFFVAYGRDRYGVSYHYDEVPALIVQEAKNPVYAFWEFNLNTGVIGGYMASSYIYGERAASALHDMWRGYVVPALIFDNGSQHQAVFDYNVMRSYGITKLPRGARVINKPTSYFERNRALILVFSGIVAVLVACIFLLIYALKQKQAVNAKTTEINLLNKEIIQTQKDLIARLGDVIETRSHETASHVMRVAEISALLARAYGLNEYQVTILSAVSPMHDVGKIGIPDRILHKPAKLTEEEFEIMKYHTNIGHEILKNTEKEMLHYASIVAFEHHEHWNGNGYPLKKKGEDIHIFGRITALADVYDALRSERVYKKQWSVEQTLEYIRAERGKFFEPRLVDLLLERVNEVENIRDSISHTDLSALNHLYTYLREMYKDFE